MAVTSEVGPEKMTPQPGSQTLRTRAIRSGGTYLVCKWAAQLLGCLVTIAVARLLSAVDYGVLAAGTMLLGFADMFAEAGVGKAIVQQKDVERRDWNEAFTLTILLSLGCYGVVSAAAAPAAHFLHTPELLAFLPVMGAALLLTPFRTIPLAILDRRLQVNRQGVLTLVTTTLQAAAVVGLALAGAGYWSLVGGALLARLLEVVYLIRLAGWRPRLALPSRRAVGLLRFGLPFTSASLLWFFYSNSDYAVVGRIAGPESLGYYALAFQLMSLPIQKVVANVNQVAFPFFCRLQGDRRRLRSWYLRLTTLLMFLVLPFLLGAGLVAEDGITLLLGEKWAPAVLPFQLLSGVGIVMVVSTPLSPLLNAIGRPDIPLKYAAACALVLPAAFVAAGWGYGMTGVCVAWLVGYPAIVGLLIYLTRGLTGVALRDLLRHQAPILAAGAFMTALVLAAQMAMRDRAPASVRLAASILTGVSAYGSFVWLTARQTVLVDVEAIWCELRRKGGSA